MQRLYLTNIKLGFISDSGMYLFFEKTMKSAVSYISERYSKASNKYLRLCDPKQKSKYFIYLIINNLYGYVMSKFLPTGKFTWVDPKECDFNKYSRKVRKVVC